MANSRFTFTNSGQTLEVFAEATATAMVEQTKALLPKRNWAIFNIETPSDEVASRLVAALRSRLEPLNPKNLIAIAPCDTPTVSCSIIIE